MNLEDTFGLVHGSWCCREETEMLTTLQEYVIVLFWQMYKIISILGDGELLITNETCCWQRGHINYVLQ